MVQRGLTVKRIFRLTNNRVRLGVGLVLAAMFCIQCCQPTAPEGGALIAGGQKDVLTAGDVQQLEALARTDHCKLLRLALERHKKGVQNYTCTLIKQERISGTLKDEQWIEVKHMAEPYSVAMKWVKNVPLGDRAIYVEGKYNGMMLVRPRGLLAMLGTVPRDPASKQVMENTLRPITKFGFRKSLESLLVVYELATARGEIKTGYRGIKEVAGKEALVLVRELPARDDYPAKRTVAYLGVDDLVPLAVEGYDWDDQLICRYVFKDVKFNVALTEKDFTPAANDMKPLK